MSEISKAELRKQLKATLEGMTPETRHAKSIADLVEWSGGLYDPPARFRSW